MKVKILVFFMCGVFLTHCKKNAKLKDAVESSTSKSAESTDASEQSLSLTEELDELKNLTLAYSESHPVEEKSYAELDKAPIAERDKRDLSILAGVTGHLSNDELQAIIKELPLKKEESGLSLVENSQQKLQEEQVAKQKKKEDKKFTGQVVGGFFLVSGLYSANNAVKAAKAGSPLAALLQLGISGGLLFLSYENFSTPEEHARASSIIGTIDGVILTVSGIGLVAAPIIVSQATKTTEKLIASGIQKNIEEAGKLTQSMKELKKISRAKSLAGVAIAAAGIFEVYYSQKLDLVEGAENSNSEETFLSEVDNRLHRIYKML